MGTKETGKEREMGKGTLIVVRNGAVGLRLPNPDIRADGSIWYQNAPLLDGESPEFRAAGKDAILAKIRAKDFASIPGGCFAKCGENPSGLLVITTEEWDEHPVNAEAKAKWAAERKAKAARIEVKAPGYHELQAAHDDAERYHREFEAMMNDEYNDGAMPPAPEKASVSDLRQKYPIAAALITAEAWEQGSAHHAKSAAGRKARQRIMRGENHETALAEMKAEFSGYCREHVWD